MIKKILSMVGIGIAAGSVAQAAEFYKPYKESHVNSLYNLLFCDNISLFRNDKTTKDDALWAALLEDKVDKESLERCANDKKMESRVRAIAYNRLRDTGNVVTKKELLGVIVEVPLEQGLDTLAAYSDGRVRYLNQSGKVAIFEGGPENVKSLAKELIEASKSLLEVIGPWDKERLAPPNAGNVRMTFIVSDGLYFGEGPFSAMQQDPMGGPVLAKAAQLLQLAVETGLK